ncbi:(2Fe-2S)-binding protein [Halotalea alkalilenta]|uniref:(2Fe-2S)-binding protein n=1 Tax=Halotalea alkalilenta TaxID=376489 RepID=UPI000489FA57|nr:(2Fe-2S)-binding protein [Halotalea alkalilenta]
MPTRLSSPDSRPTLTLHFEQREISARQGDSVASALLAAGIKSFRTTPVSAAPRGPYCMMGVCFDCLLVVDGVPNQQGCQVQVRDGMRIERQLGAAEITP